MAQSSSQNNKLSHRGLGPSAEVMHAKANRLVLDRWKTRHQRSCHFAAHKSLCRVPRTLVHVHESEGTHRFLSYLFDATSAVTADESDTDGLGTYRSGLNTTEHRNGNPSKANRSRNKSDVSANTNVAVGQISDSDEDDIFTTKGPSSAAAKKKALPLVLDIPECLRPQDYVALHAIASTHPTLRAILLRANPLDDLTFKAFAKLLKSNQNITHLGWKGHCENGDGGKDSNPVFAGDISGNGNIKHGSEELPEEEQDAISDSEDSRSGEDTSPKHTTIRAGDFDSDNEDVETDEKTIATIQRFRKQMLLEEQFPLGTDRMARLRAFQTRRAAGELVESENLPKEQKTIRNSSPVVGNGESKKQNALWIRQLRSQMVANRIYVADKKKADWVAREVRLFKKSVDAFCSYIQTFVVAERSLRADLIVMEERQRAVLIATVTSEKRDALRTDRLLRLVQSITDRLMWIEGREASFRELLRDEYMDDSGAIMFLMEPSRRTAISDTEVNSRIIIRSIGNSSWASAVRAEKARKEVQRAAKYAIEEAEDVVRREQWQLFVKELRRLKHDEHEGKYSATAAGVLRADRERRELAQARRAEEMVKDKELKAARELVHQRSLYENSQRKDREKVVSEEEQWRSKFIGICDEFLKAISELYLFEQSLFVSSHEEGRTRSIATHYLQVLGVTMVPILKANAVAEAAGITLNSSMSLVFAQSASSTDVSLQSSSLEDRAETLMGMSFSNIAARPPWLETYYTLSEKAKLTPATVRAPPASFAQPVVACRAYTESALKLLVQGGMLV